jgi:vancomycin resistance protein YoaR
MKKKHILLFIAFMTIFIFTTCNKISEKQVENDVYLDGEKVKGLNESQLLQKIKEVAQQKNKTPKDAVLNENDWEIIEEEDHGKKINEEKTINAILNAKNNENIKYTYEIVKSNKISKDLKDNVKEIGKYTTEILDQKEARLNNIDVASDCLNNVKVLQGEIFSFNEVLGKRTKEKGYEKAPIIIKTKKGAKKAYGIGGGICQISSTLYQAAKLSGMEIIERHSHSKKVGYLPLGDDASVSYGYFDLKFRNNKDIPIMIKVKLEKDKLTVRILGNYNKEL